MGALLDAITGAIGAPQRMPTNADYPSDGRWHGDNPHAGARFTTKEDLRAAVASDAPAEPRTSGLFDTVASAVSSPSIVRGKTPEAPVRPGPAFFEELQPGADARTAARVIANQATGVGQAILGGWRGLAAIASGAGLDEAARQVHSPELAAGATAAAYEPPPGSTASMAVDYNPANAVGYVSNKAGEVTTDVTGSPAAGAAVNTGLQAIPLAFIKRGGKASPPVLDAKILSETTRTPAAIEAPGPNLDIPTVIRQRQAQPVPANDAAAPRQPLTLAPNEPTPGRTASPAFEQPAAAAAPPAFVEAVPAAEPGKSLPLTEQARRIAVLKSVGIDEARESAVKGDPKAAATDFQTSRLDNSSGNYMKSVLDNERAALTNHAEQIVRDTGGTMGTDAQALEARGHTILAPLEGFRQWFTDQTNGLYKVARERAQGQPVELNTFRDILGTDSKFANTDTIELRKGLQARMKELGMMDKEGKVLPATVEQAENLRQYANEEWSPKSNGRIRELKNALDEDVARAAGEDTFKQARALHAMKMSIFDDPKGLSSILDSEGINRKVPVEKIADTIAALPNAQFAHIVKTLKSVPPELQAQAQAALAEIKAQFANRIHDAGASRQGQWGARDVTATLNKYGAKLHLIFDEAELAKLSNLNEAGHILAKDQSYPGAAVQEHNLARRGVMHAVRSGFAGAGAVVGGAVGMPAAGAAVGDMVGSAVTGRMSEGAALKATQKRVVKLADFPK